MSRLKRTYYISGVVFYLAGSLLSVTLISVSIAFAVYMFTPVNPAPIFP
jgi:hypothetical protein